MILSRTRNRTVQRITVLILLVLVYALTACGGGSDSGISDGTKPSSPRPLDITIRSDTSTFIISETDASDLIISGSANTVTVNALGSSVGKSGVVITGSGNTVSISSNIELAELFIGGDNNLVTIAVDSTVDTCNVPGNDNTITKSTGMVLSCNFIGLGNSLFNN